MTGKPKIDLFPTLEEAPRKTKKWLFFPISIFFHGLLYGAMVVLPLLRTEAMPSVKYVNATLISIPPLPEVPKGSKKAGDKGSKKKNPDKPKRAARPAQSHAFVAPLEIPTTITEEELTDLDLGFEDEDFIPGAPAYGDGNLSGLFGRGKDGGSGGLENQQVVKVFQKPKLIRSASPKYPRAAQKARVGGAVVVQAVTDIYGKVVQAKAISGHPLLKRAAINAVKKWMYEPYIISGIPKPVTFVVTVNFKMKHRKKS